MLTHADKFTCFCHYAWHTPYYYLVSNVCAYNIEISRDICKTFMAHPAKTISTSGERKREPGTHRAFSHQPMIPCTPPEFLKMIPAPPAQHACIVHLCQKGYSTAQACQTLWEPIARSCGYAISVTSLHVLQMTGWEEDTPLLSVCSWAELWDKAWGCSRNGGTRQHLRVRSHLQFV